jgi:hypothetical protein
MFEQDLDRHLAPAQSSRSKPARKKKEPGHFCPGLCERRRSVALDWAVPVSGTATRTFFSRMRLALPVSSRR